LAYELEKVGQRIDIETLGALSDVHVTVHKDVIAIILPKVPKRN
jgi:hypothetical protein